MRNSQRISKNRQRGNAEAISARARPSLLAPNTSSRQADWLAPDAANGALTPAVFEFAQIQIQIQPNSAPLLQPKLAIGRSDDPLEQQADRVAEKVLRMPEPRGGAAIADAGAARLGANVLQARSAGPAESAPMVAPQPVHNALNGPGEPLDAATRDFFEPRFGHDFSRVRIHSDARAAASARALNALAYTVGNDIMFGDAHCAPATVAGQRLLAHELAHVVQQAHGRERGIQRQDDKKPQSAPTRDEYVHEMLCGRGGGGLFGRPQLGDLFRFSGTFYTDPPDVAAAEIEDLRTGKRDLYYVDSWLDDEWQIIKIELNQVIVVSATCGTEDVLGREAAAQAKTEGPVPDQTVQAAKGTLGQGTVKIWNSCKRVEFVRADKSEVRVYQFDDAISEYVLQTDDPEKKVTYPPLKLTQVLGVRLLEYDNGKLDAKNCGIPRGTPR